MNNARKADKLRQEITDIRYLLNGEDQEGNKLSIISDVKYIRYLAVVNYAMLSPTFEQSSIVDSGRVHFSQYKLGLVAKTLGLQFDRSRIAEKIFKQAEKREEITRITHENKQYISLTDKGIKKVREGMREIESLKKNPDSLNSLDKNYREQVKKGVKRENVWASLLKSNREDTQPMDKIMKLLMDIKLPEDITDT